MRPVQTVTRAQTEPALPINYSQAACVTAEPKEPGGRLRLVKVEGAEAQGAVTATYPIPQALRSPSPEAKAVTAEQAAQLVRQAPVRQAARARREPPASTVVAAVEAEPGAAAVQDLSPVGPEVMAEPVGTVRMDTQLLVGSTNMAIYALIKNGFVRNIVRAEEALILSLIASHVIDEGVVVEPKVNQPEVGDAYSNGVFTHFAPTVQSARALKLAAFKADFDTYLDAAYSISTRVQMLNLYLRANKNGLTDRANYIETGMAWGDSLAAYAATFAATVAQTVDVPTILALTWDIQGNTLPDPKITLAAALAIET